MSEQNMAALLTDAERGRQARELLDSPLLVEAIDVLKARYYAEWLKSKPEEGAERERLHTAAVIVDDVNAHLRAVVGSGQIATSAIEQLKKRR
jgi:hypothetical protein